MKKYIVHQIYEGHRSQYDFGDVIIETDDLDVARDTAGNARPFGGVVYDTMTGKWDVGNGWHTAAEAKDWLNTPAI